MALCDRRNIKACGKRLYIRKITCSLCDHYITGTSFYVTVLSLIGIVVTVLDIVHTVCYKVSSIPSHHRNNNEVPCNIERDLKLMASILGMEHYILVMLGVITGYPMLYTPWLLMQLCVFIVEIIVIFMRFLLEGLHIKRNEILQAIFSLYNWVQVFCLFFQKTRQSI